MACRFALEVDLAEYLADPGAARWETFREHFPECRECSDRVAEWTGIEETLRAGAPGSAHPGVETLVALAEEPASLGAGERARLEQHVETCRRCADELASLRAFDFEALSHSAPASPADAVRRLGRSLQDLVPALLGRGREGEERGGWLAGGALGGPEPQVAFQSAEAAEGAAAHAAGSGRALVGVLAAVEGELDGRVFRVVEGDNRIGRGPDCEIRLPGDVARLEAEIRAGGERFEVVSRNRRRAVHVNGAPTDTGVLADGDRIEVGGQRFQFRRVGAGGARSG